LLRGVAVHGATGANTQMTPAGPNGELTVVWYQCISKRIMVGIKLIIFVVAAVQKALQVLGPDFLHLPGRNVLREVPGNFNSKGIAVEGHVSPEN
jgi:hypothetical protein